MDTNPSQSSNLELSGQRKDEPMIERLRWGLIGPGRIAETFAADLRLTDSEESTKIDFMVFLTVQTMNYLHSGRHRVAL